MPPLSANIIILNYNGAELLPKCLPSIAEAAAASSYPVRVTVLDNLSTDNGLDYVRSNFPSVKIEIAAANRFLCSYNDCLKKMTEPVAILLNNDIRVDKNFAAPLLKKFEEDPQAFLAAPRSMTFDGKSLEAGRSKAGVKWGIFWCEARYQGYENDMMMPSETFSSGFGAFSREKFLALGGYDDGFLPGIMEDVDLCYRARRAGFHLYYEPQSVVYHIGQASFKKAFGEYKIKVLAHRNSFLFMWKNFRGPLFWLSHLFFLPLRLLYACLRGDFSLLEGFSNACRMSGRGKR